MIESIQFWKIIIGFKDAMTCADPAPAGAVMAEKTRSGGVEA